MSDSRVEKETDSLASRGFKVTILAWDREGGHFANHVFGNKTIVRFGLRIDYQRLSVVFYYPVFWLWVLRQLIKFHPKIVHACDLDTILPALFYRCFVRNARVIFDVFDNFGLLIEQRSGLLGAIVKTIELLVASKPDALVTVTEKRLLFFKGTKPKRIKIIANFPPDLKMNSKAIHKDNATLLKIVYAGTLSSDRGLIELAEAAESIDNIEVILAGRVVDFKLIHNLRNYSHVRYVGELNFDESLKLQANADIIPVLYDPSVPINRLAAPNKLFEAMMLGVPVITTVCENVIDDVGCGIMVGYESRSIKEKILLLRNDLTLRKKLGRNGRQAFETKYNWATMEAKLLDLYYQLLEE